MSNNTDWDANDFSNVITISAAAIGSVLLIVFKSRCKEVNFCYLIKCKRDVVAEHDEAMDDTESIVPKPVPKAVPPPIPVPAT
tara:strand:+ start:407 stop:655 length:249 start_codon:yes stop_codon:yes gene_type:complete